MKKMVKGLGRKVGRVIGAGEIKENTQFLKSFVADTKDTLGIGKDTSKPKAPQSLSDAGYTPQQIHQAIKNFNKYFWFYAVVSLIALLYAVHAIVIGDLRLSVLVSLFVCFTAAQTFRYHFWLFQLKVGKLGCTFKEWMHATLGLGRAQ